MGRVIGLAIRGGGAEQGRGPGVLARVLAGLAVVLALVLPPELGAGVRASAGEGYGREYYEGSAMAGTVVALSHRGDDLFVQLDTNGDGQGEVWVEIDRETWILDAARNRLPRTAIGTGVDLVVSHYERERGYYEARRVVVGSPWPAGGPPARKPLSGRVLQVFPFGDGLFLALDTDGDGQGDARVRLGAAAIVTDPAGKRLGPERLRPGETLTLVVYGRGDDGYYRARHVIVGGRSGRTTPGGSDPLKGAVLEVIPLGRDLFVRLDADGDGQEDYPVWIGEQTRIQDVQGRRSDPGRVRRGVKLTVPAYRLEEGYYRAMEVVVEAS